MEQNREPRNTMHTCYLIYDRGNFVDQWGKGGTKSKNGFLANFSTIWNTKQEIDSLIQTTPKGDFRCIKSLRGKSNTLRKCIEYYLPILGVGKNFLNKTRY